MQHVWTWKGKYFGYVDGDNLWTYKGLHVGRFSGEDIYDTNGNYLGELKGDRLITKKSSKGRKGPRFRPNLKRVAIVKSTNYVGNVMYSGYEDFPPVEQFE